MISVSHIEFFTTTEVRLYNTQSFRRLLQVNLGFAYQSSERLSGPLLYK